MKNEVATIGGGCFWCLEAVFQDLRGVESVVSGYAGGDTSDPTYEKVCTGTTGQAEVVQIKFNADEISYRTLLEIFFTIHDPTTLNRQGADVGTQYRSIILYHDDAQKNEAEGLIAELNAENIWPDPIVTEVEPLETFYEGENYHQNYFQENPANPYCSFVIPPKLKKLREKFKSYCR